MTDIRPLHLHTSESVCIDLIAGQAIAVADSQQSFSLNSEASRAVLAWYLTNRTKWAGNVSVQDAEAIVDAAQTKPFAPARTKSLAEQKKRSLTLAKIEAHRFGGLNAFSDKGEPPENFICEPSKPITLFEGWNGSGKTSILNAVIWCLTGHLLRPQRKPEETEEEFTCRIKIEGSEAPTEHTLTPVSPLPDARFPPDPAKGQIHLDTWVELTFIDEDGKALKPIRRTQRRKQRGGVEEVEADIASLGIDPIAARIGTTIPGILPFIQIGAVSEFGQAIAQLTGLNAALEQTKRMQSALKTRREKEKRLSEYKITYSAITHVIEVGSLAQTQVESLRTTLDERATHWRNKIYNNAYSTSGYGLVGSDMDSKGALQLFVGSNGVSAPAQHISNASALRASLVGFYLAFWEHVQKERGGLRLMILDDPQELLDDDNRDRLARTLPAITSAGAQIILTTHNKTFARMSVAEARKKDIIEHRSVHPVNSSRATTHTAPAIEELDLKRIAFENNVDDASKAQFVALTLTDGSSIFKCVGPALPGFPSLRQFESIGGLGASEVVATEFVDDDPTQLRVMESAREILGVIYE